MTDVRRISRQSRAAASARGDCSLCCKVPARPGFKRCQPCADKHKARRLKPVKVNEAKAAKWCDECIAFGFHRWDCPTTRWDSAPNESDESIATLVAAIRRRS